MNERANRKNWVLWIAALVVLGWVCTCFLLAAVNALSSPPGTVRGSGTIVAKHRSLGHIGRVTLGDQGTLILTQGDEEGLTIETDDNILPYVESRVRDGTIVLGLSDKARGKSVQPSRGITYHLSVRQITGLEVGDSGCVRARALDTEGLEIRVYDSGVVDIDSLAVRILQVSIEDSSSLRLGGRTERQEVTAQDSGRYLAGRLESGMASIVVSDSAQAILWATEAVDVTATDSAQVLYYGAPRRSQRLADDSTLLGLGIP